MTDMLETSATSPKTSKKEKTTKARTKKSSELGQSVFAYETIGPKGKKVKKTIQAKTISEAKFTLDGQGITVLSLQRHVPWYALEFGTVVPGSVLLQATRQLASFAQAGIPISQGLFILSETIEHKR